MLGMPPYGRLGQGGLEAARERLIKRLIRYHAVKKHPLIVVFDGRRSGKQLEQRESRGGIEIVYSRYGEEADTVIKRLAEEDSQSAVVVTSDRALANYLERRGATVISSGQFARRLDKVEQPQRQDKESEEDDFIPSKRHITKKKGTAKRLSRRERRRQLRLKKI